MSASPADPACIRPLAQEYCSRGSLYAVLRRQTVPGAPPLPWLKRVQMVLGAAQGMTYLHACKPAVLHRDLKSPNLLVDAYWRVKARYIDQKARPASELAVSAPSLRRHSACWALRRAACARC